VLLDIGRCEKGDKLVIVAGSPLGSPGKTNSLRCIASATRRPRLTVSRAARLSW